MGEVANDMLDGLMCSWCGTYFEKAHGFPVLCVACDDTRRADVPELSPEVQRATVREIR